ncbi:MAG: hypothetical protein QHC90_20695 [Shinella sp.]|nr:hypothetical protein [Shinella sp.]
MTDPFSSHHTALDAPASHAFAIVPDNDAELAVTTRALYVGTGGDVTLVTVSGETVTFVNIAPGSVLPLRTARILENGTTAADLVGLY